MTVQAVYEEEGSVRKKQISASLHYMSEYIVDIRMARAGK